MHPLEVQSEDELKIFADALSIWQNIDSDESYEMEKVLNNIGYINLFKSKVLWRKWIILVILL